MKRLGLNNPQGTSLFETLIALFLLTAAGLVIVALFHSGLQRSVRIHQESEARLIAQSTLNGLRKAVLAEGFRPSADAKSLERTFQDEDFPSYQVEIRAAAIDLASPSTSEEASFPTEQRRVLKDSLVKAQVTVRWENGTKEFKLVSLLEESLRTMERIVITRDSSSAGSSSVATLTAKALDKSGKEIDDALFVWWVEPITADGTLIAARNTKTAQLVSQSRSSDGTFSPSNGECRVAAFASYQGVEVIGYSSNMLLTNSP